MQDDYERRVNLLIKRLPTWLQDKVRWLRQPDKKYIRIFSGIFLIFGGFLAILPIFGIWMLPLGFILLSEDIGVLRQLSAKCLEWIELKHPTWLGLKP